MKSPAPDVIAGLKAKHGDTLMLVEVDDFAIIVKTPSRAQFEAYADGSAKPATKADAEANLLVECAVWPSASEVSAMCDRLPALPERVSDTLDEMACGGVAQLAQVDIEKMSDATMKLAVSSVDLDKLRAQYPHPGQLACYASAGGLLLVHRPSRTSYNEFQRKTRETGGKIASALYHLCLDCVAHPATDALKTTFDRLPGLSLLLGARLREMAGSDAEVRAKKI